MKKASKVPVVLAVLLAVVLVAAGLLFSTGALQLTPDAFPTSEEVASILITNDPIGERLTLEDPEEIQQMLEQLKSIFYFGGTYDDANGCRYQYSLRDADGKLLCSVQVADESYIIIDGYGYHTDVSELYQYIVGLDWSQAEGL